MTDRHVADAEAATPGRVAGATSTDSRFGQLLRFALVGGSNTAVTFVLLVVLQRWLSPQVAYTCVFALGLAYTTAMTARVVFGSRLTWRTGSVFVGWYLLVYCVGLAVVHVLRTQWEPSAVVIALVTVGVTAPLTFIGGRLLFRPVAPTAS